MKNSDELKITVGKVLEAASKCSTAKATLQTIFPEVFKSENKQDRIKTIDDVFEECGISNYKKVIRSIEDNDLLSERQKKNQIADYICEHIAQAFNGEDWEEWQDWSKGNTQYKYIPWFYLDNDSFRLYDVYYCCDCSFSGAGGRFYFKRRNDADYCAKQFLSYYKNLNL